MNIKTVFSLIAVAGFLGCATSPELEHQVVTEIITEPPGARIEVNGNYLGEAPVTTRIRHHAADKVVMGTVVIKALPVEEGQFEQTKIFQGPPGIAAGGGIFGGHQGTPGVGLAGKKAGDEKKPPGLGLRRFDRDSVMRLQPRLSSAGD
jgi:hypothetical protein